MIAILFLQLIQLLMQGKIRFQETPKFHECPDDVDAHFDSSRALEDGGGHDGLDEHALLVDAARGGDSGLEVALEGHLG